LSRPRGDVRRVDVRHVRGGLELRVDGTLASLHRTGPSVTGTVWWALAAPVTLLRPEPPARVLVLGLGGGSVVRALRALAPGATIVGIEHDRDVLRAARRHFGLDRLGVELRAVDARDYLDAETRRFDLVIEDLFVGSVRSVRKPDWLVPAGYEAIRRRLRPGGVISTNSIHESRAIIRAMTTTGGGVVSLDVRGHWNQILLWGRSLPPPREMRRRLAARPELEAMLRGVAIRAIATPWWKPAPSGSLGAGRRTTR